LVAGGGDLAVSSAPPGREGWQIELAATEGTNAMPAQFVLLQDAALATSGDVFQYVEIGGVRYSHIVDPRTGLGLTNRSLVTVIAPNCTTADSLATAVSVLGPTHGMRLIETYPGVEARMIHEGDGQWVLRTSPRFARHVISAPRPARH
jgi:FAD:protein FMN transferase